MRDGNPTILFLFESLVHRPIFTEKHLYEMGGDPSYNSGW